MKKKILPLLMLLVTCSCTLLASSEVDTTNGPFGKIDPIYGSSEMVFFGKNLYVYSFSKEGLKKPVFVIDSSISLNYPADATLGNFSGDDCDEILCLNYTQESIDSIAKVSLVKFADTSFSFHVVDSLIFNSPLYQFKVVKGNFDTDAYDEFVLAFWDYDGTDITDTISISLILYDIQDNKFTRLDSVSDIQIEMKSKNEGHEFFDICTGDFNGDNIDELVVVYTERWSSASNDMRYAFRTYEISNSTFNLLHSKKSSRRTDGLYHLSIDCGKLEAGGISDDIIVSCSFWNDKDQISKLDNYYLSDANWHEKENINKKEVLNGATALQTDRAQTVVLKDLNMDGQDEIIWQTGNLIHLLTHDGADGSSRKYNAVYNGADDIDIVGHYPHNSLKKMAVDFIDLDTTSGSSIPGIVSISYYNDITNYTSGGIDKPRDYGVIITYKVDMIGDSITGLSSVGDTIPLPDGVYNASFHNYSGLLLGNLIDSVVIGEPRKIIKKSVFNPIVILNAPPTHFDIIDGIQYDVNYNDQNSKSIYTKHGDEGTNFTTKENKAWGISASLSFTKGTTEEGSLKKGVRVTANAEFDKNYSDNTSETTMKSLISSATASQDDKIYCLATDYTIWEYPVLYKGEKIYNILVVDPISIQKESWEYSKKLPVNSYSLNHEPGNLLSYPYYWPLQKNPEIFDSNPGSVISFSEFQLTKSNDYDKWFISYDTINTSGLDTTANFSVGVTIEGACKTKFGGIAGSISGDYSKNTFKSHETTIGSGFRMEGIIGTVNENIGEVNYGLQSYIYWSKNGVLVLDYNVNLKGKWWDEMYGQKPDLAFIMPYRYGPETGENFTNKSKRYLTSDIRYFPADAVPGDTITIAAFIRNFSMQDFDATTKVKFYLGDPDDGGELITSLEGEDVFYIQGLDSRAYKFVSFKWATPSTIPEKPWIFAKIDVDNEVEEIHKNNNKGFVPLFNDDYPPYVAINDNTGEPNSYTECASSELSIFPNPVKDELTVRLANGYQNNISINLYSLEGKLLLHKKIKSNLTSAPNITLDLSSFAQGLYILNLETGSEIINHKICIK